MDKRKSKVLIVDDVKTNLLVLNELLHDVGIEVILADNGKKAIKKAVLYSPDLILLDVIMPKPDGFEVCASLKKDNKTKGIPVIFLSGKDSTNDVIRGFNAGAVDYVKKPFRKEELLARVFTHLELKHSKDTIKVQNEQLLFEISQRKKTERKLKEKEVKYSSLITDLNDAVFRMSFPDCKYEYISAAADKVFGYSKNNFYKTPNFIKKILHPEYQKYYDGNFETSWGVAPTLRYKIIDPQGNERWIIQANKATFNKEGNLVAVEGIYRNITTGEELQEQKTKLEKTNKNITSSIRYAQFIQQAVLPSKDFLKQFIPENFILHIPRDIVSGDFYWIKQVENYVAVACADCTGHGVPGAFMSMLGIALLNEVVRLDQHPKASEILNELRKRVKTSLHQDSSIGSASDGMDISLCIIDLDTKEIQYAGANNPLYIIKENSDKKKAPELINIKPDRMPIGAYIKEYPFTNHVLSMDAGDIIYLFSDGYVDQFGGEKFEKYKVSQFKDFILKHHKKPMEEQKDLLFNEFERWRAGNDQIDDVLVIGVKILDNYGAIDYF